MTTKKDKLRKLFPEDLFFFTDCLTEGEVDVLTELDAGLQKYLKPVVTEHTEKAEFPFKEFGQLVKEVSFLDDERLFENSTDDSRLIPSQYYLNYLYYVLARFDTSIATFVGVHAGLGYYSFILGGDEKQIEYWAPKIRSFELQTCFGLTEPEHGSDIAGGLSTTAKRDGDKWLINGEKRWIGGAGSADVLPIYARDVEDGKIKCFIVKKNQKGLNVDKVENKIALRMVQNGHITLENVEVSEADRLQNINGFKDVARILFATRAVVASIASGTTAGAYLAALDYTKNRKQFGKELVHFQLVQEKLSIMQSNVVAQLGLTTQIAKLQTDGAYDEVRSSIGKMYNSTSMRETVAMARAVCGGNGIVLDYDVARYFQDAEAIYTYEGTHEINALVIGRSITGVSAFV